MIIPVLKELTVFNKGRQESSYKNIRAMLVEGTTARKGGRENISVGRDEQAELPGQEKGEAHARQGE